MYIGKRNSYISSPAQRRLPKKRRKSAFFSHLKRFIITYKNPLLIVVIIGLIITIFHFVYIYTIGKPSNIISEVVFTDESVQVYSNKELYKKIRELSAGKNIIMMKIKGEGKVKEPIQELYPFVEDIDFSKIEAGKILSTVNFYPADLLFKNSALLVAYAHGYLFTVVENDTIQSGATIVQLPEYFSGENIENNLTGYLGLISPEKLKNDLSLIKGALEVTHILYLPGAQKSIIDATNKQITFDHKRDINAQLQYLQTIITTLDNTLYYEIDLTTFPKIIIKKMTEPSFGYRHN